MFPDSYFDFSYFDPSYFEGTGSVPPFVQRIGLVVTTYAINEALTYLQANVYSLPLTMHLFQNPLLVTRDVVKAYFTEADFSGYVPANVELGGGGVTPFFPIAFSFLPVAWQGPAAGFGNDIYGWWIEDAGENVLFAGNVESYPTPVNMDGATAFLFVSATVAMGSAF
jgi:hypothetical protein